MHRIHSAVPSSYCSVPRVPRYGGSGSGGGGDPVPGGVEACGCLSPNSAVECGCLHFEYM